MTMMVGILGMANDLLILAYHPLESRSGVLSDTHRSSSECSGTTRAAEVFMTHGPE